MTTFKNTTIQNRTKRLRLEEEHVVPAHYFENPDTAGFLRSLLAFPEPKEHILYSLGEQLLGPTTNPAAVDFLGGYSYPKLTFDLIPSESFDLLGACYQYLNSKAENLKRGSFYTSRLIVRDVVDGLKFEKGDIMLDPACGSGAFLFASDADSDQILGIDSDPIAVMLAKFNYFIKFPDATAPAIYCDDFFAWFSRNDFRRFSYVVGNPPFGANLDKRTIPSFHITSGESFSYFIELGVHLLAPSGKLMFVVPEALLNVKRHSDVRNFLLNYSNLVRIRKYRQKFAGVMSDMFLVEVDCKSSSHLTFESDKEQILPKELFRELPNQIFVDWSSDDVKVISKVNKVKQYDLTKSIFGLGVVTGDNSSKLLHEPQSGSEPIFTGKEVTRYKLLPPTFHLVFDRAKLQQVAPDEIYRAPAKLVYKTICKRLRFALDESGALTSNSANILIPNIPGYSLRTVLGFLNSDLYSYLHLKLSGGVNKVGKDNLMNLPFPDISQQMDRNVASLIELAMETGDDADLQDYIHYDVFGLTESDVSHIRRTLS